MSRYSPLHVTYKHTITTAQQFAGMEQTHQRSADISRTAYMVDFEVEFWIKLVLYHTPESYKAVMREMLERGRGEQRNL